MTRLRFGFYPTRFLVTWLAGAGAMMLTVLAYGDRAPSPVVVGLAGAAGFVTVYVPLALWKRRRKRRGG